MKNILKTVRDKIHSAIDDYLNDDAELYKLEVVECHPFDTKPPITLEEYREIRRRMKKEETECQR